MRKQTKVNFLQKQAFGYHFSLLEEQNKRQKYRFLISGRIKQHNSQRGTSAQKLILELYASR